MTTAEKIDRLIRDIGIMSDDLHQIRKELEALKAEDAKPDPEPLECWALVGDDRKAPVFMYETECEAKRQANRYYRVVHMREVTPQDEQDQKDAARYRKYKELMAQAVEGWGVLPDPDNLDQQLDEAMEEK